MATSARIQSLLEQRKTYRGISPDRRRVLAPNRSAGVSSIARQNTKAELEAMIDRYNNGAIGNEEMRAFLQSKANDKYLNPTEKVDIQDQIADFDSRVEKDRLEAVFKKAVPNSMEQVQAAKALQTYYSNRAATMAEGTPAQSQNLENAAGWEQKAIGIEDTMQKTARKNFRYAKETEINSMPTNSSERAFENAKLLGELANQALADGDQTDYLRLMSQAQQTITVGNETATRETQVNQSKSIGDFFKSTEAQWKKGEIDTETYINTLEQNAADIEALQNPSWNLKLYQEINTARNKLESEQKKAQNVSALASGMEFDKAEYNYSDNLRVANKALKEGQMTPEAYQRAVTRVIDEYASAVGAKFQEYSQLAAEDPNYKVKFKGSNKRVADLVQELYDEATSLGEQSEAFQSGNAILMVVPPKEGAELGSGKAKPSYKLVNKNTLDSNTTVLDDQGVAHEIKEQRKLLTAAQKNKIINNTYYDTKGEFGKKNGRYYVTTDDAGNTYVETGKKVVNVYDFDKGFLGEQEVVPGGQIRSASTILAEQEAAANAPKTTTAQTTGKQITTPQTSGGFEMPDVRKVLTNTKAQYDQVPGVIKTVAESIPSPLSPVIQAGKAIQSVSQNLPRVQTPSFQLPKIQSQPVKNFATNLLPTVLNTASSFSPIASTANLANQAVKLAPKIVPQVVKPAQKAASNITNTLGGIGNSINQGVDWFKKQIPFKLF